MGLPKEQVVENIEWLLWDDPESKEPKLKNIKHEILSKKLGSGSGVRRTRRKLKKMIKLLR